MKAYKVTLIVVDHDNMGADEIKLNIENERYTNPRVTEIESVDIGEWGDDHPLNKRILPIAEINRIFPKDSK